MMTIRPWRFLTFLVFATGLFPQGSFGTMGARKKVEVHFAAGISPDGRKEITLVYERGEYDPEGGDLKIKDLGSGRVLGSYPYDGFGVTEDSFTPSWRSDSRHLALSYELSRGFITTLGFAPFGSRWIQMALPNIYKKTLKISRVAGKAHVTVDPYVGDKGHESRVEWLPRNRFRLEAGYRGISKVDLPGDGEQLFWATFRVLDANGKSKPKVLLEKVEFAPLSAYPVGG